MENSVAVAALQQFGIDGPSHRDLVIASPLPRDRNPERRSLRQIITRAIDRPSRWDELRTKEASAPSLRDPVDALADLVEGTAEHIQAYSEVYGQQRLKRKPWTRKEAFGNLIDWATTHQQWFARALTEPKVVAAGYPPDDWVSAQQYDSFQWIDVVDLWLCVNRLLIHVLAQIPEDKLKILFHIGVEKPIPLVEVIDRYVAHCEDLVGQILARL
jgi:hypothetical protein